MHSHLVFKLSAEQFHCLGPLAIEQLHKTADLSVCRRACLLRATATRLAVPQQHRDGIPLEQFISKLDSQDTELDHLAVGVHCDGDFVEGYLFSVQFEVFVE